MNSQLKTLDLETIRENAAAVTVTPMAMIDRALANGSGIEVIERLMALQERWEANLGRKAFDNAMAAANVEIPVIVKNREVDFTSSKGRTHYKHEDLAEVARTVKPILARHGLSYRFRTTSAPNEPVVVTCIVSHRDGYSEENTLSAGRDDSGNKNSIQAVGSTLTYLQRMTLKAALGLAASEDDDGAKSQTVEDDRPINEEEFAVIQGLIDETGTDVERLCAFLKVDALMHLTVARLPIVLGKLRSKKANQSRQESAQ